MRELADLLRRGAAPEAAGFMGKASKFWDGVTGKA